MLKVKRLPLFCSLLVCACGTPALAQWADLNLGGGGGPGVDVHMSPSGPSAYVNLGIPGAPGLNFYNKPSSSRSAGAPGAQRHTTNPTWQDVWEVPAPGNFEAGVGSTMPTGKQGYTGINGKRLSPSNTAIMAPGSGMTRAIPGAGSGFGFPNTGTTPYKGPYTGAAIRGATLQPTCTSSVGLNIISPASRGPVVPTQPDISTITPGSAIQATAAPMSAPPVPTATAAPPAPAQVPEKVSDQLIR